MSKIIVADETDLKVKFTVLVGLARIHIKMQDIYKDQFGSVAKTNKNTSMERLRKFLQNVRIENDNPEDENEPITECIINPDNNETT